MTLDAQLLKKSLSSITPVLGKVAERFYAQLFYANPELREMFPLTMGQQNDRLVQSLIRIVSDIDAADSLEEYLSQLGRDHRKYGVRPDHYRAVGRALLNSIAYHLGDDWTAEVAESWAAAYKIAATGMIAGAEQAAHYEPPWWDAEVVAHERRSIDLAVIKVRTDQPMAYLAGQYVSVETKRWPRVWRVYSMANAPRVDRLLEFHVRSVGAGMVSSTLVHFTNVGDHLRLGAPTGELVLDRGSQRDLLMVAGGTGLAPLRAIVEDLGRHNRHRQATLFFGARLNHELYDLPMLLWLADRHPWLTVVPTVADEATRFGPEGLVSDVAANYQDWTEHDVYVSGPTEMVRETVTRLHEKGVSPARIRYDDFGDIF